MGSIATKATPKSSSGKAQKPLPPNHHSTMLEMRNFFEQKCENMTPPFVPEDLLPFFKQTSPGTWMADPDDVRHSLYRSAGEELQRALKRDQECSEAHGVRWVAFGHSGHGINSWAMHYYIAYKPLYIMWASSFGGAYADAKEDSPRVSKGFDRIKNIFDKVQDLLKQGKIDYSDQITLEADPFGKSGWQVSIKGEVKKNGSSLMELLQYLNQM